MDNPARLVALVVVSDSKSVAELSHMLGAQADVGRDIGTVRSDLPVRIPARETSWEMREWSDSTGDASELIDRLFRRAMSLRERLVALSTAGCVMKLNIVQWIASADASGPGVSLDPAVVKFLAEINAAVDVDQYVEFD